MKRGSSVELAEVAASTGPAPERAQEMLARLRRVVPFDAAWLALADPMSSSYTSLAGADLDEGTVRYLSGPKMAHDIEVTGTDRDRPPLSLSDLPYPSGDLPTWAECLTPADFHEGLGVGLFDRGQRHVGFLALLFSSRRPPSLSARRRVQKLNTLLASGIDPLRSLAAAARLVRGASAGAVLYRGGRPRPLPGLEDDSLLAAGSPVITIARSYLEAGQLFVSFLWPRGGSHAPRGHVRVTLMAGAADPPSLLGTVVLSPGTESRGLTPRELEVLGLLIDGCCNQQIARALTVAERTVATHMEHILAKLGAPTRTLAAVRAKREGLYVPPWPAFCPAGISRRSWDFS